MSLETLYVCAFASVMALRDIVPGNGSLCTGRLVAVPYERQY